MAFKLIALCALLVVVNGGYSVARLAKQSDSTPPASTAATTKAAEDINPTADANSSTEPPKEIDTSYFLGYQRNEKTDNNKIVYNPQNYANKPIDYAAAAPTLIRNGAIYTQEAAAPEGSHIGRVATPIYEQQSTPNIYTTYTVPTPVAPKTDSTYLHSTARKLSHTVYTAPAPVTYGHPLVSQYAVPTTAKTYSYQSAPVKHVAAYTHTAPATTSFSHSIPLNTPAVPAAVYNHHAHAAVYNHPAPTVVYNHPAPAAVYNLPAPTTVFNHHAPAAVYNHPAPAEVYNHHAPNVVYNHPAPTVVYNHPAPAEVYNHPALIASYNYSAPAAVYNQPATITSYNYSAPAADYNNPAPTASFNYSAPAASFNYSAPTAVYNHPGPVVVYNHPAPAATYNPKSVVYTHHTAASTNYNNQPAASTYAYNPAYGSAQKVVYSPAESVAHVSFDGLGAHYGY